ncbi:probable inactive poly [ADP-ribose] polymerase SRO2 [Typha angustifolia]|uniref:probable inactive poly [ADP-ribose] polymerase SRO2 n=1 Tax=Typha angustifolia TaxID=59011 RepID=UPI003C30A9FC
MDRTATCVSSTDFTSKIAGSDGNRMEDWGIQVPLPQISDLASGFSSSSSLVQESDKFRRSGEPSRFLFLSNGFWVDFACEVCDVLRDGFANGKAVLEVPVNGRMHVFDFVRMVHAESETSEANPFAWIDVNGQCFFPSLDEQRNVSCPSLQIEIRTNKDSNSSNAVASSSISNPSTRKRDLVDSFEEGSGESPETFTTHGMERPRWSQVVKLDEGDRFYKVVEKLFLAGMRKVDPGTFVTSIHKCSHAVPPACFRSRTFQMKSEMTRSIRGDANVKFGWYGAPENNVAAVLAHGFGQPNNNVLGCYARGVGVHLSPPHSPYPSSLLTETDEKGERHILLCRVIVGKQEKVQAGSSQFHPSSDEFDSGVDDLTNPRWYVVWSTHMNSHILPEYVVSYKCVKQQQGPWRLATSATKNSASLCFSKLYAEIERFLPSSRVQALQVAFNRYKEGKINKVTFIRYLRSVAGDKLLATTIKKVRGW